jgi:hypothetical protein
MTGRVRGFFPRSYHQGRLLRLLAGDMPGHSMDLQRPDRARFTPTGGGPVIEVTEHVDRRLLGHSEIARFETRNPATSAEPGRMLLRHTGRWKRDGIAVVVTGGGDVAVSLARALEGDERFVAASLPLDFTRFELASVEGEWRSTVELMGASYVSVALPPMRSYVHLHPDQRRALLETLATLSDVVRRCG